MVGKNQQVSVERYDAESDYDFEPFDCGIEHLNQFLKSRMHKEADKGLLVPYLCFYLNDEGKKEVIGYFTLSSGSIEKAALTVRPRRDVSYSTVPCILLGRLAVCQSVQGQGLGKFSLGKAILQSLVSSKAIGVYAIALRAEEHNWPFYLQAGFTQSKHHDGKTFFYSLKQAEQYYKTLAKPR
ncbi:GNAT family N-acetyltransferase [Vibrio vulnificus]|uniref:GNAT family N-acetyltransferase n=1 Tax=Vibrio vulnificus TaxID=672 RepID=UPI0040584C35